VQRTQDAWLGMSSRLYCCPLYARSAQVRLWAFGLAGLHPNSPLPGDDPSLSLRRSAMSRWTSACVNPGARPCV